jgi:hypothetical protein
MIDHQTGYATCDVCGVSSPFFCPGCCERQGNQALYAEFYKEESYDTLKTKLNVFPNSVHGVCWGDICRECKQLPHVPELLWLWQLALVPFTYGSAIHSDGRKNLRKIRDPYHIYAYHCATEAGIRP